MGKKLEVITEAMCRGAASFNRKAEWALTLAMELALYAPFDLLACPVRDRVIPRSVKKKYPILACRGYNLYSTKHICMPGERYSHKWVIKCLCWNYNLETGECMKYRKK